MWHTKVLNGEGHQPYREDTGKWSDYQVPVRVGFLLKGSLLDANQGVYIERHLCDYEMVLHLVQFVDLHRERRFHPGKLVCRQYR
jgi:hypothetical protein